MKKTIAKIMAAAMVLSTVVAPNAQAAIKDVTSTNLTFAYAGITDTDGDVANILKSGYTIDFELNETASDALVKAVSDSSTTYDESYYSYNGVALTEAGVYVNTAGAAITNNSVTTNTNAAKVPVDSLDDAAARIDTYYDDDKVTVNGEYNDVVTDRSRRAWAVPFFNGANLQMNFFRTAANASVFDEFVRKLNNGAVVRVPVVFNVPGVGPVAGFVRVWFRTTVNWADTNYWNGIVKLKGNNDTYTPIRVHYAVESGAVAGANGLAIIESTGTGLIINGTRVAASALANQRLELVSVNSYDLEILQSDLAKGKNLLLDKIYAFTTDGATNDNGLFSAYTQNVDWATTAVNTTLDTTSVGKITTIHATLFKGCKEKFVNAENAKFINNGAFRKNKQLKKAVIGTEKNLKKVNSKAFYDCKKLATVRLSGKTLKQVGSSAFKNCKSNMIFKIKGNSTQVKKAWAKIKKQAPAKAKYAKI